MHHENCEACQMCIEELIPELAESEDKDVKESIVNIVKEWACRYQIDVESELAWLEAQGEQKPLGFNIGDEITVNGQICKVVAVEQKPADKVEPKFKIKYAGSEYNVLEVKDIAGVTFYGIEDEPNHIDYVQAENCERVDGYSIKESGSPFPTKLAKFSEQNSTWSEEDEKIKRTIISDGIRGAELDTRQINWLKSLKDRVQPQPKQEWSINDERILYNIKGYVNLASGQKGVSESMLKEAQNWLKSLKERYIWKPSEEHIHWLKWAINRMPDTEIANEAEAVLEELLEQLEKLK